MELKVLAAPREDAMSGKVWLPANLLKQRHAIKIQNGDIPAQIIFCQAGFVDRNFMQTFNERKTEMKNEYRIGNVSERIIVLNDHYRTQLKVERPPESLKPFGLRNFNIFVPIGWFQSLSYSIASNLSHPQDSVRLSAVLGLVGAWLGYISVIVSIASLKARPFEKGATLAVGAGLALIIYLIYMNALRRGEQVEL